MDKLLDTIERNDIIVLRSGEQGRVIHVEPGPIPQMIRMLVAGMGWLCSYRDGIFAGNSKYHDADIVRVIK